MTTRAARRLGKMYLKHLESIMITTIMIMITTIMIMITTITTIRTTTSTCCYLSESLCNGGADKPLGIAQLPQRWWERCWKIRIDAGTMQGWLPPCTERNSVERIVDIGKDMEQMGWVELSWRGSGSTNIYQENEKMLKNLKLNIYVALSLVFSLESVFKLTIEKDPLSYDVKLLTLY